MAIYGQFQLEESQGKRICVGLGKRENKALKLYHVARSHQSDRDS